MLEVRQGTSRPRSHKLNLSRGQPLQFQACKKIWWITDQMFLVIYSQLFEKMIKSIFSFLSSPFSDFTKAKKYKGYDQSLLVVHIPHSSPAFALSSKERFI
uniref:Uncharacterized protein n=1 Tax=Anguilla anguilla TaxID=7936 RepID=A0A0E9WZS6_ANGAN